jgi:hypothetical protein
MTKVCSRCRIEKEWSEFNFRRSGKRAGRPRGWCRVCDNIAVREWKENNPEKAEANKERTRLKRKKLRETNPEAVMAKNRKDHLERKVGIGQEGYDFLLSLQDGKCALCRRGDPGQKCWRPNTQYFAIDHDHSHHPDDPIKMCWQCIRGLLCYPCNGVFLGHAEKYEELQTDIVKKYLAGRPLVALRKQKEKLEIEKHNAKS